MTGENTLRLNIGQPDYPGFAYSVLYSEDSKSGETRVFVETDT
jgi:hypothetical protein